MYYEDVLQIDLTGKTVVIIGQPASGKTTLANALSALWPDHTVLHTDARLGGDMVEAMYLDLLTVSARHSGGGNVIIEGMQGVRMLRKGAQTGVFYPEVVIELTTTADRVAWVYETQRGGLKKGLTNFNTMQNTILRDYRELPNPHPPLWYRAENLYNIFSHA